MSRPPQPLTGCVRIARAENLGTVPGMPYPGDLTDDQWTLLEPVFNAPGKSGSKHAGEPRTVALDVRGSIAFAHVDRE